VRESAEVVLIVYVYSLGCYGTIDSLGVYASEVRYSMDGVDQIELIDNEDFIIMNEIVLTHIEEENE
jgi:hypothetical protein